MNNELPPPLQVLRIEPVEMHLHPSTPQQLVDRLTEISILALNDQPKGPEEMDHEISPMPAAVPSHEPAREKEANFSLLEKLINLISFKTVFPQSGHDKKTTHENTHPVVPSKVVVAAKGEHVATEAKVVEEEVEGVARTQVEGRIDPFARKVARREIENGRETVIPKQAKLVRKEEVILKMGVVGPEGAETTPKAAEKNQSPFQTTHANAKTPYTQPHTHLGVGLTPAAIHAELSKEKDSNTVIPISSVAQINANNPLPTNEKFVPPVLPLHLSQFVQRHENSKARPDAIAGVDPPRHVAGTPLIPFKQDDRDIVRVPLLPDMPISKEAFFRNKGSDGYKKLLAEDGHRLDDVVLMILCAVLCGSRNVAEIWSYLQGRQEYFTMWLGLKSGLPTYRVLAFVLGRIQPKHMAELIKQKGGQVRLWESDRGLLIGQLKNHPHSSMQEGLNLFDLKGALVQIDAPHCEPDLVRRIVDQEAQYIVTLRGTHGTSYDEAIEFFEATFPEKGTQIPHDLFRDVQQSLHHVEQREVLATQDVSWLLSKGEWSGLATALKLTSESVLDQRTLLQRRFYLTSLPMDAKALSIALRSQTVLENRVEWLLDIDFSSWQVDHTEMNLSLFRIYSWSLLNSDSTYNATPEARRKKAVNDPAYLRILLQI